VQQFRFWIRQYFGYSQRETNAFLALLSLILLFFISPLLLKPKVEPYSSAQDQKKLDELAALLDDEVEANRKTFSDKNTIVSLHSFNPNELTEKDWVAFGIKPWIAKRILNYRQKVGDFKSKEEVGKIYGLQEEVFQQLYPFILLPETSSGNGRDFAGKGNYASENRNFSNAKKAFRLQPFDMNLADTSELKKIRGIGSKLSARILNYRDRLGGFTSEEQLQEIFGLQPETLDSLHKYTYVENDFEPNKINLNSVTIEELKMHPYLKFNLSRAIIAYRDQHGPYQRIEDLKRIKLMDEATFNKLRPYLAL
jgi:competence protein ComEA